MRYKIIINNIFLLFLFLSFKKLESKVKISSNVTPPVTNASFLLQHIFVIFKKQTKKSLL